MAAFGKGADTEVDKKMGAEAGEPAGKRTSFDAAQTTGQGSEPAGSPTPEQKVPFKDTVVPFGAPLQPLREPAMIIGMGQDPHPLGSQVLAFADKERWEQGIEACERVASGQCEKGARMGCSLSATRKCQPNWFQQLPWFKKRSTPETMKAQEECETREFDACFAKARGKCAEQSQKLCSDVYESARVAGRDGVMLITDWEDEDELAEYRQLQTGEKVISSSKGAPWMPPALGASIETQVPDEADAERRRSAAKAASSSRGGRKGAARERGGLEGSVRSSKPSRDSFGSERASSRNGEGSVSGAEERATSNGTSNPNVLPETSSGKSQKEVAGTDGVAYRVVRISARKGPDGKPLRALQSLKDGSIKILDANGEVQTLIGREKGEVKKGLAAGDETNNRVSKPRQR